MLWKWVMGSRPSKQRYGVGGLLSNGFEQNQASRRWFAVCKRHWAGVVTESQFCVRNRASHRFIVLPETRQGMFWKWVMVGSLFCGSFWRKGITPRSAAT